MDKNTFSSRYKHVPGKGKNANESLPVYQKKKGGFGLPFSFGPEGTRKAGPTAGRVKTVRWTVFRPWESPSDCKTRPGGVWIEIGPMYALSMRPRRRLASRSPFRCNPYRRENLRIRSHSRGILNYVHSRFKYVNW